MAIARARVYHSVPFDVRNLVTSSVATLRSQGPPDDQVVETFERRFAEHVGAAHCVSFAFARTAVHQALESQALSHGSEVLMPPITISPMMDAVLSLGLRPVFVDIDPNSLIFDVEAFERDHPEHAGSADHLPVWYRRRPDALDRGGGAGRPVRHRGLLPQPGRIGRGQVAGHVWRCGCLQLLGHQDP